MADQKDNQGTQSSESTSSSQSSESTSNSQGQDANPSWPSVHTSESISAIRNDIRKSGDSGSLTTKESGS